ncbi:antitoxin [Nonomuraea sp. PA05]|uniref:antitoxin n=1 Tax=Nonomuraea sp. PA05 TaxID=2604466 RepID=UPI0011DB5DDE|nr:antitoxin [Nonomuraea sp. PA05]TYB57801.1 antitoxin [Nonomuraea sp. PA05]
MSRIGDWLKKAENLARGHSKQADQALDRAERYVKERTGHKYDDQITKGVDAVQRRYGGGSGGTGPENTQRPPYPPQQQQPAQPYSQEERERRS